MNAISGVPIPRVLVRLNERAILTDHEGRFQFDQTAGPSGGSLQVSKPGFYLSTDPAEPPMIFLQSDQPANPISIRLYPEALLTGTITAPTGEPLPHIFVTAQRSIFDEISRHWVPATQGQTDSHGNFRLTVPSGDYRLETRYSAVAGNASEAVLPVAIPAESQSDSLNTIHVSSGEEQHFDLHPGMSRTYTVTARLELTSEHGFPGLSARSSMGVTIPLNFQRSPASNVGRFQLPSGTYTVTASLFTPDGGEQAVTTVTVPDHDVSGVVLRLTPNPSIPVELLMDSSATSDKPLPNIHQLGLTLQPTHIDPDRGVGTVGITTSSNRAPSFNLAPGSYRLQARNNGEWYVKSVSYGATDLLQQDLVAGPGAGGIPIRVVVSNQTSALQGLVKLNGTTASCWVYLIPTSNSAEPVITIRSATNGAYNVPYLPPATYQALALEHRHSADYRDPAVLQAYSTHLRSVTINPGDKSTLDLDAVTAAEQIQ